MTSSAFDALAEPVKRWVWRQKWPSLRDVQEKAIPAILDGGDVVISARTAAGKTEAAFLPLISRVLAKSEGQDRDVGFSLLYVSPLKALINDQHRRLESLAELCELPLHRWHGDVSGDAKKRARERPYGIVLITPESLEALLVRRGREAPKLFSALEAVVIDELHAFIGSERGVQLQSILTRIEIATRRDRIDRIGLSATLGDMRLAAEALRPGSGDDVWLVEGKDEGNGLKLQIKGYERSVFDPRAFDGEAGEDPPEDQPRRTADHLAYPPMIDDLFRILRGRSNLLFAGSRQNVEIITDALASQCESARLPNEFFAHHGNLAKSEREDVELRLREDPRPTTAVATTTLELGIDIGDVETVAQVGPGFSVASLRQRLGRSGRRLGKPAILRMFIVEDAATHAPHPADQMRFGLIQAIAIVECLIAGWCEPPRRQGLHLSTLVHQTLAIILQTGGIRPATAWRVLAEHGPFRAVDRDLFAALLRQLASRAIVTMSPDGLLMIGPDAERIVDTHDFYAVFETPEEYRVIHATRTLGTYPLESPLAPGQAILFGGRRWTVLHIDDDSRTIDVTKSKAVLPPVFGGSGGLIHDRIVEEMRNVLLSSNEPTYLDTRAVEMLRQGRKAFSDFGLIDTHILELGSNVFVFPWVGSIKLATLTAALVHNKFEASFKNNILEISNSNSEAVSRAISACHNIEWRALASQMSRQRVEKFDCLVGSELLLRAVAEERLSISSISGIAERVISH